MGFSSKCPRSKQLENSSEPAKNNSKRARPGEDCRPRPRDRQLIQDRIKELWDLVPNDQSEVLIHCWNAQSSTCILQSITKHADKINKCANLKLRNKEPGMVACYRSEHGSIIVENLYKNGQMLVEVLGSMHRS